MIYVEPKRIEGDRGRVEDFEIVPIDQDSLKFTDYFYSFVNQREIIVIYT